MLDSIREPQSVTSSPPMPPRRRSHNLESRPLDDELMVMDVSTDRVHFLNSGMAAIWRLCDGSRSAEQITQILSAELDCSEIDDLAQLVQKALTDLHSLDLLTT